MAVFGVEIENNSITRKYLRETKKRFETPDLARNPFNAYLKVVNKLKGDKDLITVFSMRPLWPNFPPFVALLSSLSLLLFGASIGWFIIPILFLLLGFFWTETFFYLMFRAGLKKAGFKGPVNRLKKDELIDELARRV